MRLMILSLWIALASAPAAAQPDFLPAPEQRQRAGEVLGQLLAEDAHPFFHRDADGEDNVVVSSRPRASRAAGICEYDQVQIRRAAAGPDGAGRIRRLEAEAHYLALADDDGRVALEVDGDALERRCAALSSGSEFAFRADNPVSARLAVLGLVTLRNALASPQPGALIEWACVAPHCPSAADLGRAIEPLRPDMIRRPAGFPPCPERLSCVFVGLPDGCGLWLTQIRSEFTEGDWRFHSARIGPFEDVMCE